MLAIRGILANEDPFAFQTFHASYTSSIDADSGGGNLTGTPAGSPTPGVSGGNLVLVNSSSRNVSYDAVGNGDMVLKGCIRIGFIPRYTGNPSTAQGIISIGSTSTTNANLIHIQQNTSSQINLFMYESAPSSQIFNLNMGSYSFTNGTLEEIELNFDITTKDVTPTQLFIDGIQHGSTLNRTQVGLRDTDIDLIRVGAGLTGGVSSGFTPKFDLSYIKIFSEPQHTANYTPE